MDPMSRGNDSAVLNDLLGMLNNPALTGADVPETANEEVAIVNAAAIPTTPVATAMPTPIVAPVVPPITPISKKVYFTGRLAVGKDYVAAQIGAPIFGFADPIYYLANYFHPGAEVSSTKNKDLPGMRKWLQQVGQWGRNDIDDAYPYAPARSTFCHFIRLLALAGSLDRTLGVEWENFGLDPYLWSKAVLVRANAYMAENPGARVSNTNVRFKNEFDLLSGDQWEHYHVLCSPQTWLKRLAEKKMTPESPLLKDKSEHLATNLDAAITKIISKEPRGKMLKVIWNDYEVPAPSPRFFTLAQFCKRVAESDAQANETNTGE
jgi:hypothetical protein